MGFQVILSRSPGPGTRHTTVPALVVRILQLQRKVSLQVLISLEVIVLVIACIEFLERVLESLFGGATVVAGFVVIVLKVVV
jgi:hypothetical protein